MTRLTPCTAFFLSLLLLVATTAQGGVLPSHSLVDVRTQQGGPLPVPGGHIRQEGDGSLDTGVLSYSETGITTTSSAAQAVVRTDSNHLLGVATSGFSTDGAIIGSVGTAKAVAAHRDIAFTNAASPPAAIRLHFGVEGFLNVPAIDPITENQNAWSVAALSVRTSPHALDFFDSALVALDSSNNLGLGLSVKREGRPNVMSANWASVTLFASGAFVGTGYFDVPFDAALSGYDFGIALVTDSYGKKASASSSALNSLSLNAVTLLDGTPISVTFDSGLQLSETAPVTVPEPGTVGLLGIGAALLMLAYRRRFQKSTL